MSELEKVTQQRNELRTVLIGLLDAVWMDHETGLGCRPDKLEGAFSEAWKVMGKQGLMGATA